MCKACVMEYCVKEKKCGICGVKIKEKDVIELKESGSAFAAHSKVETKTMTPAFQC